MAEVINTNVFDAEKKFVDFAGLDYFWEKAKAYVDGADKTTADKVATLEGVVGDSTKGLVKEFADLALVVDGLGKIEGGEGIVGMIDTKIAALDLPNTYDAKGAAADALDDAKAYADGLASNYDAAGTATGLDSAMDARVKVLEAIDHDKLAADAAAAAVATVIDDAPESFDTLKEVAAWIANNDHASDVAGLMTDVENLKKIDHDAYVAADTKVLDDAKAYADGLVMVDGVAKFDAVGTAAAAIEALKLSETYDAKGAAADAQTAAIAQAKLDAAETLKGYYTKTEVDNLLSTNSTGDRAYAKQYTDELFGSFKFAANSDIDALFV